MDQLPPHIAEALAVADRTCDCADQGDCAGEVKPRGDRLADSGRRVIVRLCDHHAE